MDIRTTEQLDAATATVPCPDCGGPLCLDTEAETETLVWRAETHATEVVRRAAVVIACSGCEFCYEVKGVRS